MAEALESQTICIKTGCGNLYTTVAFKDGKPIKVFVRMGKAGGCAAAQCEAISKLLARALELGDTVEGLSDLLKGISCFSGAGHCSCPDAIAQCIVRPLATGNNKDTEVTAKDGKE